MERKMCFDHGTEKKSSAAAQIVSLLCTLQYIASGNLLLTGSSRAHRHFGFCNIGIWKRDKTKMGYES